MPTFPDHETGLLQVSPWDRWRLGDSYRNTLITGDSGSGKTSGSGAALRKALLKSGAGGLILVAKPEEAELVRRHCKATGRLGSLIEFNGRNGHAFNFLQYETARLGANDGINSIIESLMRVLEASRMASASPGRGGDQFWEDTTRQLLRHSLPVIFAVTGSVTIADIIAFVRTAPRSPEEFSDPEWQRRSIFFRTLMAAENRLPYEVGEKILGYWQHEFCALDNKTRGNIVISLSTTLDRFQHGWLQRAFCADTTWVPEMCFHGAIVLLDMPVLSLGDDAIVAQMLVKFIWQRAMLARNALPMAQQVRPCFLWIDEYQFFASSFDPMYLSACRASQIATVLLTQSLPTLYSAMLGEHPRDKVNHLIGNCATKIWHSTSCIETATWASDVIGRSVQRRGNFSQGEGSNRTHGMGMNEGSSWGSNSSSGGSFSHSKGGNQTGTSWSTGGSSGGNDGWNRNRGGGSSENRSWGYSEAMDRTIEPADLGRVLKTGGKATGGIVTGILSQSGRVFEASGSNTLLATFAQ